MNRLQTGHAFFLRDLRRIARHTAEIDRQCAFYKRNGAGNELRVLLINIETERLAKITSRILRRYAQFTAQ